MNIEVNYDDPTNLKKVITKLQKRRKKLLQELGYKEVTFNASKYNFDNIYPTLNKFISRVPRKPGSYYVYAHTNPLQRLDVGNNIKDYWLATTFPNMKYKPFYIGKGINNRLYDLNRNDSHRKIRQSIKQNNKDIEPIILFNFLSEETALLLEERLVDCLGIISLCPKYGYLVNLDEGKNPLYRRCGYTKDMLNLVKLNGFKVGL